MHVLLSLTLAAGLLLIFLALTSRERTPVRPGPGLSDGASPLAPQMWSVPGGREHLPASLASGALAAVATQALLGWPALSLAAAGVGALLPAWFRGQRERRRREAVEEAVAEAVDALRDATRVGIGLEDGLRALAHTGPLALRPSFRRLERDLRLVGFEETVERARAHVAHPAFDMMGVALLMSYRIGGRHLSAVLDGLGRSLHGTARARREVRAQQAEHVMSARVIAALPLALIVAIRATNPAYLEVFSTPVGQLVLAGCLVSVAAGYAAMRRATALPGHERVLR